MRWPSVSLTAAITAMSVWPGFTGPADNVYVRSEPWGQGRLSKRRRGYTRALPARKFKGSKAAKRGARLARQRGK